MTPRSYDLDTAEIWVLVLLRSGNEYSGVQTNPIQEIKPNIVPINESFSHTILPHTVPKKRIVIAVRYLFPVWGNGMT